MYNIFAKISISFAEVVICILIKSHFGGNSMKRENVFVKDLIKKMTLDQKIGALLTLGFAGTVPRQHIYDYIKIGRAHV